MPPVFLPSLEAVIARYSLAASSHLSWSCLAVRGDRQVKGTQFFRPDIAVKLLSYDLMRKMTPVCVYFEEARGKAKAISRWWRELIFSSLDIDEP